MERKLTGMKKMRVYLYQSKARSDGHILLFLFYGPLIFFLFSSIPTALKCDFMSYYNHNIGYPSNIITRHDLFDSLLGYKNEQFQRVSKTVLCNYFHR